MKRHVKMEFSEQTSWATHHPENTWTKTITSKRSLLDIPMREIWSYRDLLVLLVKRDYVAAYKQTILGPLWLVIQPLLTTVVFAIVFGGIARISTDGVPPMAFYLAGVTLWAFFSDSLVKTAETFTANAGMFGKVYFPRMIVPLSIVISNLVKFAVQLAIFGVFVIWYWANGYDVHPNMMMLALPVVILLMGVLGLGLGMIVSALTSKYRDLRFLLTFAVQLLMYATPVVYPASALPSKYATFIKANPMTPIMELFRYGFLGRGTIDVSSFIYSSITSLLIFGVAIVIFNQIEKNFMDTV